MMDIILLASQFDNKHDIHELYKALQLLRHNLPESICVTVLDELTIYQQANPIQQRKKSYPMVVTLLSDARRINSITQGLRQYFHKPYIACFSDRAINNSALATIKNHPDALYSPRRQSADFSWLVPSPPLSEILIPKQDCLCILHSPNDLMNENLAHDHAKEIQQFIDSHHPQQNAVIYSYDHQHRFYISQLVSKLSMHDTISLTRYENSDNLVSKVVDTETTPVVLVQDLKTLSDLLQTKLAITTIISTDAILNRRASRLLEKWGGSEFDSVSGKTRTYPGKYKPSPINTLLRNTIRDAQLNRQHHISHIGKKLFGHAFIPNTAQCKFSNKAY